MTDFLLIRNLNFIFSQATDYVTLSFVNTRSNRRVNINSKYGQKVRGDKSLIEANNIYIPCGTRGEYYLSVMSNYVNYENDYRDNQETWWVSISFGSCRSRRLESLLFMRLLLICWSYSLESQGPYDIDTKC